jgi:hypothetical protein
VAFALPAGAGVFALFWACALTQAARIAPATKVFIGRIASPSNSKSVLNRRS